MYSGIPVQNTGSGWNTGKNTGTVIRTGTQPYWASLPAVPGDLLPRACQSLWGNRQADRLASTANIIFGLQLGRAEVLRGLRNFLNMDRPEHHRTDHLKESGVEKGSGRHSTQYTSVQTATKQYTSVQTATKQYTSVQTATKQYTSVQTATKQYTSGQTAVSTSSIQFYFLKSEVTNFRGNWRIVCITVFKNTV